jgi:Taurine catabolism dioxygenase TauD, TfdA family
MGYTITPLTPHTGAEVPGIDLNEGVDAETRATLNRAFAEHHVLMARGQQFTPPHLREELGLVGIAFDDREVDRREPRGPSVSPGDHSPLGRKRLACSNMPAKATPPTNARTRYNSTPLVMASQAHDSPF